MKVAGDERRRRRAGAEGVEGGRVPPAEASHGSPAGRCRAADRDRRLADAEREAALLGAEPAHHRAAARRVDARAERAREDERPDERR